YPSSGTWPRPKCFLRTQRASACSSSDAGGWWRRRTSRRRGSGARAWALHALVAGVARPQESRRVRARVNWIVGGGGGGGGRSLWLGCQAELRRGQFGREDEDGRASLCRVDEPSPAFSLTVRGEPLHRILRLRGGSFAHGVGRRRCSCAAPSKDVTTGP
ncbi:hypothetical protein B0H16DRAFT_397128, partial [Mycena metata]